MSVPLRCVVMLLGGTNSEALVLSVLIFQNIQRKAGITQNFVTGHVVGLGFSGAAASVEGVLAGVSRVTKEFNTRLVAPGGPECVWH